jgi:hypothetical protein
LAARAVETGSLRLDDFDDRNSAVAAGLTSPVIYEKHLTKVAGFAIFAEKIPQGCATLGD